MPASCPRFASTRRASTRRSAARHLVAVICRVIVCPVLACGISSMHTVAAAATTDAAVAADESTEPGRGTLPLSVRVTTPQALLRAGPGDDFYPTERLSRDTEVEVWAIDEAGWCAVRPVEGSFSWMRDRDVAAELPADATGPAVGVVVVDGAIARIGSRLNPLRHVTQVALEAGERVRVLERVSIATGRHAGDWLRIEPPAGEFRWIAGEDLGLPPEFTHVVPVPDEPAGLGLAAAGEAIAAIRDAGTAVRQAVAEMHEPAAADGAAPGLLPGTTASRLFGGWLPLGTNVLESSPAAASPIAPPTAAAGGAAAQSADELADIDLALSLAVAGPPEQWHLDLLRERLRLAATRATSETERTRARAIDARLARFEEIQTRQRSFAGASAPEPSTLRLGGMWSSLSALGSRPIRPGVLPGGVPADGQPTWTPPDQVVTTGRLATVISRRPDAPRWALVDEKNEVLAFVTPQAGVNLAPLVGQQVSVRGAKGYMPEYKRPYLVASDARVRMAAAPPAGITQ
jgi:hypothetical protein